MSNRENKKNLSSLADPTDSERFNDDLLDEILAEEDEKAKETVFRTFRRHHLEKNPKVDQNTCKLINFLISPMGWNAKTGRSGNPYWIISFRQFQVPVKENGHLVKEYNPETDKADKIKKEQKRVNLKVEITDCNGKPAKFELLDRMIFLAADNIGKYTENFAGVERSFFRDQDVLSFYNRKNPRQANTEELLRRINSRIDYLRRCDVHLSFCGDSPEGMKIRDRQLIRDIADGSYEENLLPIIRAKSQNITVNGYRTRRKVWALESEPILLRIARELGHINSIDRDILELFSDDERNELDYRLRFRYDHDDRRFNKSKPEEIKRKIRACTLAQHLGTQDEYRKNAVYRRNLIRKIESLMKNHQKKGLIAGYERLKDENGKLLDEFRYYPIITESDPETEREPE